MGGEAVLELLKVVGPADKSHGEGVHGSRTSSARR